MVNPRKSVLAIGMLASFVLLIHGCGGGGGGGGAPAGTPTQSAAAASKTVANALGVAADMGGDTDGDITKASLKRKATSNLSNEAQVRQALQDFKRSLGVRRQKTLQATTDTGVRPCSDGGTSRLQTNDNDTPDDPLDDSFTETYVNCAESEDDFTIFSNGSVSLTQTDGGQKFTWVFKNFTTRITDSFGVFETFSNGTMLFSGSVVECGDFFFLENATFTLNLSETIKETDSDGTVVINEAGAFNNFVMTLAEAHAQEPDCTPGPITFSMNGKSTFTNHLNSVDNTSATFTNFQMVITPATRQTDGVDTEGDTLSLNGGIAIDIDCVNGSFTISTPEGEEPFIPIDASCPVDGKFLVTRGDTTTAVIFIPGGGVQIDEGDDGLAEQTFDDCEAAEACV